MRQAISLTNVQQGYKAVIDLWASVIKPALIDGKRLVLTVRSETRTLAQNSIMWSVLEDIATQTEFVVDGRLQKVSAEDVKDIITAAIKRQNRMALGLDGGLVHLGQRTSKMTIAEMGEVITCGHALGDERGIKWRRTSLGRDVPDEVAA